MAGALDAAALPLLFPPRFDQPEDQRAYFARRFAEYAHHLEACRADTDYRFVISDLDAFRAFFDAQTEERAFIRELIEVQRIAVAHVRVPQEIDALQAELWRRNIVFGAGCWQGLFRGTLGAGTPQEAPSVAVREGGGLRAAVFSVTEALVEAEKLSALALLTGVRSPEGELDRAWHQLLFAQRGLSASGGPKEEWHLDLLAACREAAELVMMVRLQAMAALARHVNTAAAKGAAPAGASLLVANLSGAAYTGACTTRITLTDGLTAGFDVRDPRGRAVPFRVDATGTSDEGQWAEVTFEVTGLPAIGYHTYSLRHAKRLAAKGTTAAASTGLAVAQTTVHAGALPPDLAVLAVDGPGAQIAVLKRLGHADSQRAAEETVLVRVRTEEGAQSVSLECGLETLAAWGVDLLEQRLEELPLSRPMLRRAARVTIPAGGEGVVSLALSFRPLAAQSAEVGAAFAPPRPTYSRYWEHRAGAAPAGRAALGVWAGGELPCGKNTRFPIYLSNDSDDHEYTGMVDLIAPEHWTLIPRRIPYRLAAGAHGLFEAMVIVPEDAPPCFLRAETQDDERVVQDVLPVGNVQPLQLSLAREESGFVLTLSNPNADYVEGQVTLITPLEAPEQVLRSAPHAQPFRVGATETASMRFAEDPEGTAWAVARVAWYGRVQYVRVESGE